VSSVRFERTLSAYSARRLLPLGYEDVEPPPGADPGLPPYESGAAAVRGVCGLRSGAAAREDAELVPLWVGKYDPAHIIALADVGVPGT
jgi:hypothetical protein